MAIKKDDPNQISLFGDAGATALLRLPVEIEPPSEFCIQNIDRIRLYRDLFVGRDDLYAIRWENPDKNGYAPACHNEWMPVVCGEKGWQSQMHGMPEQPLQGVE